MMRVPVQFNRFRVSMAFLGATLMLGSVSAQAADSGVHKGFFVKSPDENFKLGIGARVQSRLTYLSTDGAEETLSDDKMRFAIQRARLTLKGHVWNKNLQYKFQTDFGKGSVSLKDFFVDYQLAEGLHIRTGQWKMPFSRQQLTSSSRLELVDRAITDKAFGAGRDIGIALHNNLGKSPEWEWAIGVFNGTGVNSSLSGRVDTDAGSITSGKFSNVPGQFVPTLAMRVGYNYGGIKGYSEGDQRGGGLRFAVGASSLMGLDLDDQDDMDVRGEVDFVLKARGLALTGAWFQAMEQEGKSAMDQAAGLSGYHLQMSYHLDDKFVPVARYARLSEEGPNNDRREYVAGVASYFYGHKVKWQSDFGAEVSEVAGEEPTDYRFRTQLQVTF